MVHHIPPPTAPPCGRKKNYNRWIFLPFSRAAVSSADVSAIYGTLRHGSTVQHNYNIFIEVSPTANIPVSLLVSVKRMYSLQFFCFFIICAFDLSLQILDPRTVMTFPDHSHLTKAAPLSSVKTSTATLWVSSLNCWKISLKSRGMLPQLLVRLWIFWLIFTLLEFVWALFAHYSLTSWMWKVKTHI